MSRQDRQKFSILVILVVVLGLTLVLGYRMNRPPSTEAVQSAEPAPPANPPTASDARIRLDIVENPDTDVDIGQKNLFQYGQRRPAPQAVPPVVPGAPVPNAPPQVIAQPAPVVPAGPPPPPPIPFRFTGFAIMNSSLTAFLSDESQRNFIVTAGEVLFGRYRITQITDTSVEIEDLQFNRRQMLALQK